MRCAGPRPVWAPPATACLDGLGGQFELMSTNVAPAQLQYVAQHRLAALGGWARRLAALPDTPTLAELGVPQANLSSRVGLSHPAARRGHCARRGMRRSIGRCNRRRCRCGCGWGTTRRAGGTVAAFEAVICTESVIAYECARQR